MAFASTFVGGLPVAAAAIVELAQAIFSMAPLFAARLQRRVECPVLDRQRPPIRQRLRPCICASRLRF
jgi:hypothetical protein